MKYQLALYIFLMLPLGIVAQQKPVRFQHITAKDGLSQGHVLCMIQDSKGYIWAGTYHGLNRFNGYNFDAFYAGENDSGSLFINVVFSLFEDNRGKIWCGTWGVDVFDPLTELFTHIPAEQGPNSISAGEVSRILEDQQGNIWLATQGGGLNKYNPNDGSITHFRGNSTIPGALQSDFINDIVLDNNQILWIATEGGGLSRMDLPNEEISTYRFSSSDNNTIPSDNISCLYLDRENRLWLGDQNGNLAKYIGEKDRFSRYHCCPRKAELSKTRVFGITQGWDNNLIVATNGAGLIIFDPENETSKIFQHKSNDPETIISNEISSVLVDRSHTLFAGSFGRGISKYSHYSSKFDVFTIETGENQTSDINAFTDAMEDTRGNLITGTYHGFFVFDTTTWEYRHYLPGKTYEENKILTLTQAPDSSLWFCTMKGIHRYDRYYRKLKTYYPDTMLKDQSVYAIEFDHRNNLWIGIFNNGLIRVDKADWKNLQNDQLKHTFYQLDYGDPRSISGDQHWIIKQDTDSNLWIGGVGGLDRYNYDTDDFDRIFSRGAVKTFDIDEQKNLWIGTIGTGFHFLNCETGDTRMYTTYDGLSHSFVYEVVIDDSGNVWISSEGGLSRFNPHDESFRNYDIRDGLPDDHFDDKAGGKLSDNRIYMGTNNGFVIFNPDEIRDDTSQSVVVLSGLRIDNETIEFLSCKHSKQAIPVRQLEHIDIRPGQRDIELGFAALHFAAPHKIRYRYKLIGYDKEWIHTDAGHRVAKYTNLDGGDYTFAVYATNSDGYWGDIPLTIGISVTPPLYKTFLFKIIIIILLTVLSLLAFRWRLIQEVRQKELLARKVDQRTKEIRKKNKQLEQIASDLKESNIQLEERQQQVEEQSEELASQRDELAVSNTTKDKLFSVIAHDLKNPFNVLLGYTDLLIANYTYWDDKKKLYFLSLLKETSGNAYRLLENLLQWSRSQSGMLKFNPSVVKVEEAIQTCLTEVKGLMEKKSLHLDIDLPQDEDLRVYADINMLSVILRNLLTNAIKFSQPGSRISLTVATYQQKYACFSIHDTGIGMKPETLESLFDFESTSSSEGTEGEKGTGLGLVLCREFVKHHRGSIWGESIPNRGTTFHFTIPLKEKL